MVNVHPVAADENGNITDLKVLDRLRELPGLGGGAVRGIICRGDSQTAGQGGGGTSYPMILAKMLPSVPVAKRGYPGETPKAISTRQGSTPFLVTFPGGIIPASGSATITIKDATTDAKLYYGAFAAGGVPEGRASIGTIANVHGEIKGDPNAGYTFNRTTSGETATAFPNMPFVDEWESTRRDWNQIIMVGRNTSTTASVLDRVQRMVDFQTAGSYLVLSVLTRSDETQGTTGYTQILDKNTNLATAHGENYLDVRRYMIDHGLAYLGLTPTDADTTAINGDTIPPALMDVDKLHPNANGYRVLAKAVHDKIVTLGWVAPAPAEPEPLGADDYTYRYIARTIETTDGATVPAVPSTTETATEPLAQSTVSAQPTIRKYGADAYLDFDGTNDFMRIGGFSHTGPLTVMMVARMNNAVGVSKTTIRLSTASGNPQAVTTVQTSTNLQHNHTVRGSTTLSGPLVNLGDGKFHALGSVWNGATSVASIDSQTTTGDTGTVNAINAFSIGDSGAGAGFADFDIAEVIVWKRALTAAELVTAHNALKASHPTLMA